MNTFKVEITGLNTSKLSVLSHEENIKLFRQMKNGDQFAKDKIIKGNLKLVLAVLKRFSNHNINSDDLFQIGVVGLIKAVNNFNPELDLKLSTYAIPLIIGEIKKYIRDNTEIHISRGIKDLSYRIVKYKEDYFNMFGHEPSEKEICITLEITPYELSFALNSLKDTKSIFEPVYTDSNDTIYLEDQISDKKDLMQDKDALISLKNALKEIKRREKEILISRYVVGKTQKELADSLNVSQAQISRIEKTALAKVRRLIK